LKRPDIRGRVHKARQKVQSKEFQEGFANLKSTAKNAAKESVRLGRKAGETQLFKDVAPYAIVCALIAIPIPLIGPVLGAAVGTGLGVYKNFKRK
jgi:hypothetical protein